MGNYHICCITYKELDRLVKEALTDMQDEEVSFQVVEGLREGILDKTREAIAEGAEVLIAGGANAEIAADFFNVPVLKYRITDFDYLRAINKGFELGQKPAIVTYKTPASGKLMDYLKGLGKMVCNLVYEDTIELKEMIVKSDADVIIGAAHPYEIGLQMKRQSILLYPGKESIYETIADAKSLILELRREKERAQYVRTMMDYSTNSYFLLDREMKIIDFNQHAGQLLKTRATNLRECRIYDIMPECGLQTWSEYETQEDKRVIQVEDKEMYQSFVRLADDQQETTGAVVILSNFSEIKKAQFEYREKQRRERQEKGFIAKKWFTDIIGQSLSMKHCLKDAEIYAKSDASLLLYGETGVGKEIFSQSIHNASLRKEGPFIAVNCAALPENLLESELFGYDEGAFTGGRKGGKKGLFELADSGTIFLDEIGEVSPMLQARLLRVLQEKEIMHVGGDRIIPVDVRVISATNRNLEQLGQDRFRRDLLYRLNVLELYIPALRDRENDGTDLFLHYSRKKSHFEYQQLPFTQELNDLLKLYSWPGNIRELQNASERFVLYLEQEQKINEKSMKRCLIKAIGEERLWQNIVKRYEPLERSQILPLAELLKQVFSYSKDQIAAKLGISRTTLWRASRGEGSDRQSK